ncbi:DUF397 domain-containing protein [Solwaraspora sp. WMMD1047]|uniref:DUF397 domain-containing protein n=1 Tax=Solwaraspora sp. WMMD1047 TaxID=3016102 RepID=UPI002417617F|nr:DUF397 domain-containing protein [Solwaraspora sp. WMMD1047]MDG4828998.1 DUF397 domain-containing protein [Solwaraspora sp. WMMD1047]
MITPDLANASWRKSSRSSGDGQCTEVAVLGDAVGVRDSKDPAGPALRFSPTAWTAFVAGLKDGASAR